MNHALTEAVRIGGRQFVCGCLLLAAPALWAAEADRSTVYDQVREQLQAGNPAVAYEMLLQHEADWSGEPDYDYLFGIAALDSGEASEAVFSLQRVVTGQPEFSGARLELARAYFELGDNEQARTEFEQILTENPPENVLEASTDYLKAIEVRARSYTADIQYSFDLGFGHDSNAPAATADDVFLNFQLSPNNLEQDSTFLSTAFGATYNRPLSPDLQLLLNARLDHRSNPSTHFVDASNVDLGAGFSYKRGQHTVSVAANRLFSWLDREEQKKDTGISASYVNQLSKDWTLMAFARYGEVRFEESTLQVQDVDRLSYGLTISQTFTAAVLNVSLTGGGDDADQSTSPFSLDTHGIAVSNTWYRPSGRAYFVDASYSETEYDDQFFGLDREEETKAFSVGATLNKFPAKDWVSTIKVAYSQKDSTVSLYEFDRVETGVTLQRVF